MVSRPPLPHQAALDPALVDNARALVVASGNSSTSWLAHHLKTSWRIADRVMAQLAAEGVVSDADDDGARMVL